MLRERNLEMQSYRLRLFVLSYKAFTHILQQSSNICRPYITPSFGLVEVEGIAPSSSLSSYYLQRIFYISINYNSVSYMNKLLIFYVPIKGTLLNTYEHMPQPQLLTYLALSLLHTYLLGIFVYVHNSQYSPFLFNFYHTSY